MRSIFRLILFGVVFLAGGSTLSASLSKSGAAGVPGVLDASRDGKVGANVAYTYDALNRVASETSNGATHLYRYDLAGNRLGVQYGAAGGTAGGQRTVVSTYDGLNRLSTMVESGRTTTYGYDLSGNVVRKGLPDGEVVTMAYDGLNRMQSETGSAPQGVLYSYFSLCDAVGNLCFSSESTAGVPSRNQIFGYDGAYRLISEQVYDANYGFVSGTTYDYLDTNNRWHKYAEETKDLKFEVDRRTDNYAEQRGREQVIHDQHPEARVENGGLNKDKPIRDNNPKRQEYLDAAKRLE